MRTDAQTLGDDAESAVAAHLVRHGWTILGRQVRVGRGELDLVGIDPGPPRMLVIVEVRWRRSRAFGIGEETLDWRKRAHLRAAIGRLLDDGGPAELAGGTGRISLPIRVDLVLVEPPVGDGTAPRIRHHRAIEL